MGFKELDRYPDYEINEQGFIRRKRKEEPLRYTSVNGHPKIVIQGNTEYISRLVAETFLKKPEDCNEVMHKDGNKQNNCVDNLKWSTHSDIQKQSFGWLGVNAPGGNEPPKKVMIVETGEIFPSIRACARAINGTPSGIRECLKGKQLTHKGFSFVLFN